MLLQSDLLLKATSKTIICPFGFQKFGKIAWLACGKRPLGRCLSRWVRALNEQVLLDKHNILTSQGPVIINKVSDIYSHIKIHIIKK